MSGRTERCGIAAMTLVKHGWLRTKPWGQRLMYRLPGETDRAIVVGAGGGLKWHWPENRKRHGRRVGPEDEVGLAEVYEAIALFDEQECKKRKALLRQQAVLREQRR